MTSLDLHSPDAKAVRQAYSRLTTGVPLVLTPVRLETRVLAGPPPRLGIRVYPDQIHLDQHDPALTDIERALGADYWAAQRTTRSEEEQLARWDALAAELGPHRAAYVATATADGKPTAVSRRGAGRYEGRVRLLPSRWVAFGYVNGEEVFAVVGERIPSDLAARIDGAGEQAWLTDYATALRLGMALEVALTGPAAGFLDRPNELVVTGIRAGLDPVAAAAELSDTLQHHAWTGGLGIAAQGHPTNVLSTPTGDTAAVDARPAPAPVLPAPEPERPGPIGGPVITIKPITDGTRLAQALGLADNKLLAGVPYGDDDHAGGMRQMHEVLWPLTLGEMLRTLLAGTDGHHAFPDIDIDAAHDFFVDHVRGGGPLPALRVRDQPYGVLPVKLLDPGSFGDGHRGDLLRLLTGIDGHWNEAVDLVARMDGTGPRAGDAADLVFMELISGQPDPWTFAVRHLDVRQEVEGWAVLLLAFGLVLPTMGLVTFHAALTNRLLLLVQVNEWWVQRVTPLADPVANYATAHLHRQAVESLRAAFVDATPVPGGPIIDSRINTLACIDICDALLELIDLHEARLFPLLSRSTEVSAVFPDTRDPAIGFGLFDDVTTAWDGPLVEDDAAPAEQRAASYLAALAALARAGGTTAVRETPGFADTGATAPLLGQLARQCVNRALAGDASAALVAGALSGLATRAPEELDLLLRQALGTVSYRLDAWLTAVALADLDAMRATSAAGCHLGGYGWVENLNRGDAVESDGFVHTPSLTHAITASILRSGWKTHGDDTATSALAVDLSSARVRAASELLDGVRRGVALGDLMGHRFERGLHDAHLDAWIDPCRRAVLDATGRGGEAVTGPVDGLVLAGLWDHGTAGNALAAALGSLAAITDQLKDLDMAVDAVVDVTTAESVHQIVQGNLDRAAATFDAVATGTVAPPELEVAVTPRRSRAVTHRVAVAVPGPAADLRLVASAPGVLGAVSPALDRLAAELLPDPDRVVATVAWNGARKPVALSDLGVAGLDAVHLVGADGDASALVHRIRLAGAPLVGAPGDLHSIAVDLADTAGATDGASMQEFVVLAASLHRLLATSRPLAAADLVVDEIGAAAEDPDVALADAVVGRLRAAHAALATAIGAPASERLGVALDELARLQVRSALRPLTGDAESWHRVAAAALAEAAQRLARLASSTGASGRRRVEIALGTRLPLPHPVPCPSGFLAAAGRPPTVAEPDAAVPGWLQRLRRTRPQLAVLDDVLATVEVLATAAPAFAVVQQPVDGDGRWVADAIPEQNTLHVVVASAAGVPNLASPEVAGLIVDDWVEPVPLADTDTGLAFHFDTPGAEAPQAVLLALPPERADAWSAASVAATLRSTLGLVRRRAVGPTELATAAVGDIAALGHYLPATNLPEPVTS